MSDIPCHGKRHQRRPFWSTLVAIAVLVSALGFFSLNAGTVHAASTPSASSPAFPSVDQFYGGKAPTTYRPTATEKAYAADKSRLSNEYDQRVLTGKESLAAFETHYRAFMVKWQLGNVSDVHMMLTRGAARMQSAAGRLTASACPSVVTTAQVVSQCPVYAAQFPEESWNWCGPATLATTVVENSFSWPGANTYNGVTMTYNAYMVTQPSGLATNDELWLAQNGVITNDGSSNWLYENGTSVNAMNTMLNHFTNGHGGNYVQEWLSGSLQSQVADFQGKVASDIGTGWDVPAGIFIGAGNFSSMPGYPYNHSEIDHWIPVTFISSDHNTTYYSDPVYAAPAYSGWSVPAPYESTATSNIVYWTTVILW